MYKGVSTTTRGETCPCFEAVGGPGVPGMGMDYRSRSCSLFSGAHGSKQTSLI